MRLLPVLALALLLTGCPFVEYGDDDDSGPDDDDFGPGDDDDFFGDDDDFTSSPECDDYCDDAADVCPGLYPTFGTCQQGCSTLEAGSPGDIVGDSLACRLHHLELAASAPEANCPAAGFFGGSSEVGFPCSSDLCITYCRIVGVACAGGNAQYADVADCVAQCAGFGADGAFGDESGDTVQCRITYAERAFGEPKTNCGAAGPSGDGVCGT